jgi:hypothetical protein
VRCWDWEGELCGWTPLPLFCLFSRLGATGVLGRSEEVAVWSSSIRQDAAADLLPLRRGKKGLASGFGCEELEGGCCSLEDARLGLLRLF